MAKTNNIIELNGKRYDVVSGTLVSDPMVRPMHSRSLQPIPVASPRPAAPAAPHLTGSAMDGMLHAQQATHQAALTPTPKAARQHQPHPVSAHKPQPTKTLMRHAVKAPKLTLKPDIRPQTALDAAAQKKLAALPAVTPKASVTHIDPQRVRRAQATGQSGMVRRFAHPQPQRAAAIPARQRPAAAQSHRPAASQAIAQQPAAIPTPASSSDLFDRALQHATSHDQPAAPLPAGRAVSRFKRRHRRALGVASAALAVVLIGGFIAYQNKAVLQLQLASSRAGFHASLPTYKPDGYAVKGLQYNAGAVTVGFQNGQNQSFKVIQKKSNWNTETLLENYVATSDQPYQGYDVNGRTIYVYGKGNATWVNGGVWYTLNATDSLSNDQIVKVAGTM